MATALLAAWLMCQAFDGATTTIGVRRPGVVELNPIMRGAGGVTLKVSVNLGAWMYHRRLARERAGWRRAIVPIVFASSGCVAGAWNARQLGKQ